MEWHVTETSTKIYHPKDLMGCPWKYQPKTFQKMTPYNPSGTVLNWLPTEGDLWTGMRLRLLMAVQPPKIQYPDGPRWRDPMG